MDALTPAKLVHYFDTLHHRILCGVDGFDQRSTKHARDVTCDACIGLLRDRPMGTAGKPVPSAAP
jgi:hypothetical protein